MRLLSVLEALIMMWNDISEYRGSICSRHSLLIDFMIQMAIVYILLGIAIELYVGSIHLKRLRRNVLLLNSLGWLHLTEHWVRRGLSLEGISLLDVRCIFLGC